MHNGIIRAPEARIMPLWYVIYVNDVLFITLYLMLLPSFRSRER